MRVTSFRPHGQFTIRTEGRIVITDITGPWNRELIYAWGLEMNPIVRAIGPHVGIAVMHGSMICTHDAMAYLAKVVRFSVEKRQSLGHILVAGRDVEGRGLIDDLYIRMYEGVVEYGLYDSLEPARAHAGRILAQHGLL